MARSEAQRQKGDELRMRAATGRLRSDWGWTEGGSVQGGAP